MQVDCDPSEGASVTGREVSDSTSVSTPLWLSREEKLVESGRASQLESSCFLYCFVPRHPTSAANLRLLKTTFSCIHPQAGFVDMNPWFHRLWESSEVVSLEIISDLENKSCGTSFGEDSAPVLDLADVQKCFKGPLRLF